MFSEALADKAMTDSLWRRHTALGRKVASNIMINELLEPDKDSIYCPVEHREVDRSYCDSICCEMCP